MYTSVSGAVVCSCGHGVNRGGLGIRLCGKERVSFVSRGARSLLGGMDRGVAVVPASAEARRRCGHVSLSVKVMPCTLIYGKKMLLMGNGHSER